MEGQEQQQVDIYALVDAYKDLLDTKEELKELTTENNKAIMEKVAEDRELQDKVRRIAKVKGLREPTIVCVIAETEGFHYIENREQIVGYAGLDVKARQSGKEYPRHCISYTRSALYAGTCRCPLQQANQGCIWQNLPETSQREDDRCHSGYAPPAVAYLYLMEKRRGIRRDARQDAYTREKGTRA